MGFTSLYSTCCRAQPATWHIPLRTRAITHRLVTWHIRDDKQYFMLLSDFTNGVWRPSTMEDAVPYLRSYSLIFTYNLCRQALASTLNAWDSHGPVQPLPRVLRESRGYCLSPVFPQKQHWGYTVDLKYREIQHLFPAGICLITSPLKKNLACNCFSSLCT